MASTGFSQSLIKASSERHEYFLHLCEGSGKHLDTHLSSAREKILKGAKGLKGSVLILGVSQIAAIPLRELAEQFNSVTVVDLNPSLLNQSVSKLPEELRKKCTLKQADISGSVTLVIEKFEKWLLENPKAKLNELQNQFFTICKEVTVKPVLVTAKKVSYVVSHTLLTEIANVLYQLVSNAVKHHFNRKESTLDIGGSFTRSFGHYIQKYQLEHIQFLRDSVRRKGRVHLSFPISKLQMELVQHDTEPVATRVFSPDNDNVFISQKTLDQISKLFADSIISSWNWITTPHGNSGLLMYATTLTPK